MVENSVTLTCRDGLAYVVGSSAGPTQIIRCYSRDHGSTQPSATTSNQYPITSTKFTRRGNWRDQTDERLERMEKSGSHLDQQLVEKQNGKRHQKATGKCGSIHHLGIAHWGGDGGDRVLVVRQLLVSGPRHGVGGGGLTSVQGPPKWRASGSPRQRHRSGGHVFRRRRGKLISWRPIVQSGERLATRRDIGKRRVGSLTSRPLRKERWRGHG